MVENNISPGDRIETINRHNQYHTHNVASFEMAGPQITTTKITKRQTVVLKSDMPKSGTFLGIWLNSKCVTFEHDSAYGLGR